MPPSDVFDLEGAGETYLAVLAELVAARPKLVLPPACTSLSEGLPVRDLELARAVHTELTRTLRGMVEDLGYDPDMLPAPPAPMRVMSLSEEIVPRVLVTIPDPDDAVAQAVKRIPGQSWDGVARRYVVPLAAPAVAGLRVLVRDHRVQVEPAAAAALKELAVKIAADPGLAAVAVVSVRSDGRPALTFRIPDPGVADAFKRVQGLRWDADAGAFLAPKTRLREVMAIAATQPVSVDRSVDAALAAADEPLAFDGTLEGLRGVPVTELDAVQGKRAEKFAEFGISSVLDLLLHLPLKYLDRSNLTPIRSLAEGQEVGLLATVTGIVVDQRRRMVKITLADATGKITATYFNAAWQAKRFRSGDQVTVYGKVDAWTGNGRTVLSLTNPLIDPVGDISLPVIPIYPQSAKSRITTWEIQSAVGEALRRIPELVDPLPDDVRDGLGLMGRRDALQTIHLPASTEHVGEARERLAFDELFRMQLALLLMKASEQSEVGIAHHPTGKLVSALHAGLPFGLTGAQTRALAEIAADMASPHPMHRLLQGDVGAGKSLVAISALLAAVESGYQGALMAPTEILATQLFHEIVERTAGLTAPDGQDLRIAFFSNKLRGRKRDEALAALADGSIHIAVGTHALLVGDVAFADLGLAVVDEQHRFGVEQRAALRDKGPVAVINGEQVHIRPDMLVMTATPIPRTAAMTVFGDLDVSILDELPPGRTPILTDWIDAEPDLEHASAEPWSLVRSEVAAGRQAYVVCPLVEESEKLQAASAVETFDLLRLGALAGLRVGLVHGQQNGEERTETMRAFRAGELDVLVATTVIEVGVNVPNATVMVILDSNRFGIAQLHQLRGRVGRGVHASSCVLVGRCVSSDSRARMEALVASTDGFYLSEVDLSLRGHGQVFGAAQSGQSDLRVADLDEDRDLLVSAREHAALLLAGDATLSRRPALRAEIAAVLGPGAQDWLVKS